jgi:hypothetical protein
MLARETSDVDFVSDTGLYSAVRFTDSDFLRHMIPPMNRWAVIIRPLRGLANLCAAEHNDRVLMKDKDQTTPQTATKKPAKAAVSDAEFRRRLKNISEWRKKRLAQLRAKDSR